MTARKDGFRIAFFDPYQCNYCTFAISPVSNAKRIFPVISQNLIVTIALSPVKGARGVLRNSETAVKSKTLRETRRPAYNNNDAVIVYGEN